MKSPLLVLDSHYLCHRAFHAQGDLSFKGRATGVVFGFLQSIGALKEEFQTDRIVFCFEHHDLFRKRLYPAYKEHRHTRQKTEQEKEGYKALAVQIRALRTLYLPVIGFRNVFCMAGMESDDIMASIADNEDGEIILVTSDADLWQCLRPNVSIYSPQKQKIYSHEWFERTYGFAPSKWAVVKAMSGCSSDCVKGIPGVGEKSAVKYLQGKLTSGHIFQKIVAPEGKARVRFNRRLVELPFQDCPRPVIQEDAISKDGWKTVCEELGMRSIVNRLPIYSKVYGQRNLI